MDKVLFGERIKLARESSGMSKQLLAGRLGVKEITITKWEAGEQQPRADRVNRIASMLNVPLLWLLAGSQQVPDQATAIDSNELLQQKYGELSNKVKDLQSSLEEFKLLLDASS